ncbi:MAG: RICIN domain-containing protein [Aquimonas sp.]|nr:RICIN domain-containing protein [Aquimonas sp.]
MKHAICAAVLLLGSSLQASAQGFTADLLYTLSPQFQPDRSLNGFNEDVTLQETSGGIDQQWRITPIPGQSGVFRVSPQAQPDRSLDVVDDGAHETVVLAQTADVPGQFWKLTPVPDEAGFFRLSPQVRPGRSLDVLNDDIFEKVVLDDAAELTGQFWQIAAVGDAPEPLVAPVSDSGLLEQVFQVAPLPNADAASGSALQQLKATLGESRKVTRMAPFGDPFESDTWEFDDFVIWFDNAQESGITIGHRGGEYAVGTPLGVVLNESSVEQCRAAFGGALRRSSHAATDAPEMEVWKGSRGGVWYFLYFNADKVLMRIKISSLDLDNVG